MNVFNDGWFWVENEEEWHDVCPEAEDIPDEYPVSVQILETDVGIIFSVLPPELGTYLWNSPYEMEFIPDFDIDKDEDDGPKYH